ncbi:hypothetical protein G195_000737 [Phytophthora kernoviae 00238/432]|uniref:Response regulatory domain-containing protein n=1 Tax=Phytophthora kernoviae 00238/432 TaxID=1284355 RepID=A0A8J4WBV1_9STRA|nr:hypothetical protein G195_000737 [Phytophthora kernoviae 00238/432]
MMLGALSSLLNLEEDMEVVGRASNGQEALALVREHMPDICLMDIEMPVKSGLEAAEELKGMNCKVIILTTFARTGYFERALKGGVRGYLLKDSPIEELAESIRQVMNGRRIFAPDLVDEAYVQENPLTERENAVLGLMADGKNTKEIAGHLFITTGTEIVSLTLLPPLGYSTLTNPFSFGTGSVWDSKYSTIFFAIPGLFMLSWETDRI